MRAPVETRAARSRPAPDPGRGRWPRPSLRFVAVAGVTLVVSLPFLWMVSLAFKPPEEVFAYPPELLPRNPTLENFEYVLQSTNLPTALTNSLVVSGVVSVTSIAGATLAGYAFTRLQFPGRDLLFYFLISVAMVPVVVQVIPLFLIVQNIPLAGGNDLLGQGGTGLLDTRLAIMLPHLCHPLMVFLARQYFMDMPSELAESARVDGAGEARIFFNVYLPLARPIVATIAVLAFVGAWEDFLWPLVVVSSPEVETLPLLLDRFVGSGIIQFGPLMAATFLAILPVLVFFALNQRHFMSGLTSGSVKG